MTGEFLLDTNAVIASFANRVDFRTLLGPVAQLYLPSTAVGELYYGAEKSGRAAANIARVDALVAAFRVLPCDAGTAAEYGRVRHALATKGRPIPINDVWIAAIALQHDLTLVTRDAHFQHVTTLLVRPW